MLCFLFAGLIVALDQFFKHWILRTLRVGEEGPEVIPGLLGLTRWENDGAMLNILSGQQWLLAGIAFGAAIVLVMILLRYNEGFWGTIGLAAVLGGTVGNLVDRIFNDGKVVDMFRTLPFNFPIFNIADIFITLGFITFLIHFIAISFKPEENENAAPEYASDEYDGDYSGGYDDAERDEFADIDAAISAQAEQDVASPSDLYSPEPRYSQRQQQKSEPRYSREPQQSAEPRYSSDSQYSSEPQYSPESQYAPDSQYMDDSQFAIDPQYMTGSQFESSSQFAPDSQYTQEPASHISGDYEPITETTPDLSYSMDDLEAELGSLDDYSLDDILREYGVEDEDNIF